MKLSQNFTKTIREAPSDETAKNAQFLIRAGYVHKTMAGVYSYLPLGLRMINKIENIIRKNLNAIGGQEILMNSLHPKEWWITTNRWENVDILFKVKSQTDKEYAIACSHEEQVTPILSTYINSWKDLPEYKPYIFETDIRDQNITIQKPLRMCLHQIIYCRATDKYLVIDNKSSHSASLFDYYPVGGGVESNESFFEALYREFEEETGQSKSKIISTKYIGDVHQQFPCPALPGYFEAVNKNLISSIYYVEVENFIDNFMESEVAKFDEKTKWVDLEELRNNILPGFEFAFFNYDTVKNEHTYPIAVYQIQTKFRDELRSKSGVMRGREFRMKDMYDFHRTKESADNYYELVKATYHKIFEEMGLKAYAVHASGGIFTSNDSHEFQVICEAGEDEIFYDVKTGYAINSEIIDGMKASGQAIPEGLTKAISAEVGNIFKLDDKYTKAFTLTYTDKDNKPQYPIMNCHGVGTSRTMGVLCEIYSDEKGLKLPAAVAPFEIHIITSINDKDDAEINNKILDIANKIYNSELKLIQKANGKYNLLDTSNINQLLELAKEDSSFDLNNLSKSNEILWDDRGGKISIGEKLKDADLIGCPTQIIISKKSLENRGLEVIDRASGERVVIVI